MAIFSESSSGGFIFSLKVLLISSGVLSMAALTKFTLPLITEFAISDLPSIYTFLISWLRPPYLYLLINCIIITIVASSKFQHKSSPHEPPPKPMAPPVPAKNPDYLQSDFAIAYGVVFPKSTPMEVSPAFSYNNYDVKASNASEFDFNGHRDSIVSEIEDATILRNPPAKANGGEDETSVMRYSRTPELNSSAYSFNNEKPPVSVRFGHRKPVKASTEGGGRTLRVAKTKRNDTLETTWKTITDGRPMPLTRHLKKSDTCETNGRHVVDGAHAQDPKMTKSGTFNAGGGAGAQLSVGSGRLKKEPSLGQEELNRRVESFINKFNEDMRLQRQESLNQYMEMINRGAH